MADLREKIISRKLISSSQVDQIDADSGCGHHGWLERRRFRTPAQHVVDCDKSWGRSIQKRTKIGFLGVAGVFHDRSKYTPVSDGSLDDKNHCASVPHRLRFPSSPNDIDIRNDPEFDFGTKRHFGVRFTDEKEFRREKTYKMVKEFKCQQEKVEMLLDENRNLRRKLKTADNVLIDTRRKFETKQEDINHVEGEMHTMRRKIETDEVLVKDLLFENRNKRELIISLDKEIKELKKTKFKLLGENAQIRNLAKKISDDSDNLLKVITELKAERKVANEKIINLMQTIEGEKNLGVVKISINEVVVDECAKDDVAPHEEVNQAPGQS